MNCKPFELARVVPDLWVDEWARGRIVQVRVLGTHNGLPAWTTDPVLISPEGAICETVQDCILRPLRDPGDDAKDETLTWKNVPHKEIA
jgi:hypothetical protein